MKTILLKSIDEFNALRGNNSFYNELKYLKNIEYLPSEKIIDIRNKKLEKIINYAYKNVPMYKNLWDQNNVSPDKFNDYMDLESFPVLTKDIIRSNFPKNVITSDYIKNRAIYDTTSGSSGKPLEFFLDKNAEAGRMASYMFFNTWMDVKPIDKHLHIKTVVKSPTSQKIWFWIIQKQLLNVLDINREKLPSIISLINDFKATYFEGYSASLMKLAALIDEDKKSIKNNPKSIIATSENLFLNQKKLIESVFDCRVFNRYGSREFSGAVAQECNYFNGLHINPNLCYLEIVGSDNRLRGNGKEGRILTTDLNNFVMPLIRYEIGDIGIMDDEDCNCGRNFQNLKTIMGRSGEYLISKSDEKIPLLPISSGTFSSSITSYVYMYQFVQPSKGELVVKVVPTEKYTSKIGQEILEMIQSKIDFKVELEVVSEIPPEPNGKTPLLLKKFQEPKNTF